jgi:tRNA threonylcarbamoyl adenosine modification protein YjeE
MAEMRLDQKLAGAEATSAFGQSLGRFLEAGDILALGGGLGAGKSTLARGIINQCHRDLGLSLADIPSPTFTLVQSYPWPSAGDPGREIWHIDLWRVDRSHELAELGFEEAIGRHAMIIEWPERLGGGLPSNALQITLTSVDEGAARNISIVASGQDWQTRLSAMVAG